MAWWYGRAEEDFLRLPFRRVARMANEMIRLQAVNLLQVARSVAIGHHGKKEHWEEVESVATSGQVRPLSQKEINKGMQLVNSLFGTIRTN